MKQMKQITNLNALNEAYDYQKPSCFSRGMSVIIDSSEFIYISGTASIDENGVSLYENDFSKQLNKAFNNIKNLLEPCGASWKDVIKTTIYIKYMEKDYELFNILRKEFFEKEGVYPYPASTCVQATLCRPELLVEIDAVAIVKLY